MKRDTTNQREPLETTQGQLTEEELPYRDLPSHVALVTNVDEAWKALCSASNNCVIWDRSAEFGPDFDERIARVELKPDALRLPNDTMITRSKDGDEGLLDLLNHFDFHGDSDLRELLLKDMRQQNALTQYLTGHFLTEAGRRAVQPANTMIIDEQAEAPHTHSNTLVSLTNYRGPSPAIVRESDIIDRGSNATDAVIADDHIPIFERDRCTVFRKPGFECEYDWDGKAAVHYSFSSDNEFLSYPARGRLCFGASMRCIRGPITEPNQEFLERLRREQERALAPTDKSYMEFYEKLIA